MLIVEIWLESLKNGWRCRRILFLALGKWLLCALMVLGAYVPADYFNTIDTVRLVRGGVYQRVVYNVAHEMVLKMSGRWEFDPQGNKLRLHRFYLNLDDDLASFPEVVRDTAMDMNTIVAQSEKGVQFCVGYYSGQNCYHRIQD